MASAFVRVFFAFACAAAATSRSRFFKAERASLVADARADVVAACAAVTAADAAVAAALRGQASCRQRFIASERLIYDMTAKT